VTIKGVKKNLIDIRSPRHYQKDITMAIEQYSGRFSNQLCYMLAVISLQQGMLFSENISSVVLWRTMFIDEEYRNEVPQVMWWLSKLDQRSLFIEPGSTLDLEMNYGR
jgi:hypothetical protein